MSELTDDRLRETLARAIYETDPHYESGEYVDSFMVSPGGNLTWEQALARDAEFAGNRMFLPITKFAFEAADACLLARRTAASTSTEAAKPVAWRCWDDYYANGQWVFSADRPGDGWEPLYCEPLTPPTPKVTTDEAEERK